ncbi:hypothetical protein B0H16DRAFT_1746364 [Mycena metata]|uniref:Uncharacterized protein n=1 Tax=Mycena metata TaxID=1033252 RepID=A0AAD7MAA4_9AGAR|nr:hypothetical protein B0H16DRAFT_1746364 [Mycena metata]
MNCARPPPLSLPPRGKSVYLDLNIAEVLVREFALSTRKINIPSSPLDNYAVDSPYASPMSLDSDSTNSAPSPMSLDLASQRDLDSDTRSQNTFASSSEFLSDADYVPPRSTIAPTARSYALCSHDSAPVIVHTSSNSMPDVQQHQALTIITDMVPSVQNKPARLDIQLSPFPDGFTCGHMDAMKFDFIQRDDEVVLFVDLDFLIGTAHNLHDARKYAQLDRRGHPAESIAAGIKSGGMRGGRPQNVQGCPVTMETVATAVLRESPVIQTIASFQDAALRHIAPRAWANANNTIEAVLQNDSSLRLPFYIPSLRTAQPTAFSRVEYRFTTEGFPGRESTSTEGGMCALTALGDYAGTEGELILWEDKKVEVPGYQMVLIQSCDGQLGDYVANGFYVPLEADTDEATLIRKAEAVAERYSTCAEYDEPP